MRNLPVLNHHVRHPSVIAVPNQWVFQPREIGSSDSPAAPINTDISIRRLSCPLLDIIIIHRPGLVLEYGSCCTGGCEGDCGGGFAAAGSGSCQVIMFRMIWKEGEG